MEYTTDGVPLYVQSWTCFTCPAGQPLGYRSPLSRSLRDDALAHLKLTGHQVSVLRGTVENLYPLRTSAAVASLEAPS